MKTQNRKIAERNSIWNVWSYNSRGRRSGDYITHGMEITSDGKMPERTICGLKIGNRWDSGWMDIPKETLPGCRKCRTILTREGIMSDQIESILEKGEL